MPFVKKKDKVKLICINCGKEFEAWPYKKNTAKFCSNKCRFAYVGKRTAKYLTLSSKRRGRKVIITCNNRMCGKQFIDYYYMREKRKYCSLECYLYARSKKYEQDTIVYIEKQEENRKNNA